MIDWIIAYYLGLAVFALNGLVMIRTHHIRREMAANNERLRRLYMRGRR